MKRKMKKRRRIHSRQKVRPVLDLHGRTTDEVFDLLDRHIVQHSHVSEIKIIVGRGTGAVKRKAIEYLNLGKFPYKQEIVSGKINEGCLIVELD